MDYLPQDRELMQSVHDFMAIVRWMKRFKWFGASILGLLSTALVAVVAILWSVTQVPQQVDRLDKRIEAFQFRLDETDKAIAALDSLRRDVEKLDDLRVLLAGMKDFPAEFQRLSKLPDELAKYQHLPTAMKAAEDAIRVAAVEIEKLKELSDTVAAIKEKSAETDRKLTALAENFEKKSIESKSRLDAVAMQLTEQRKQLETSVKAVQTLAAAPTYVVQVRLLKPVSEDPADGGVVFVFRAENALRFLASKHPGDLVVRSLEVRANSVEVGTIDSLALEGRVVSDSLEVTIWTNDKDSFSRALAGGIKVAVQLASAQ